MSAYIGRRVLLALPTLFLVSVVTFLVVRVVPGDPAYAALGEGAGEDPEVLARLQKEFGLDKPLVQQYVEWVTGAVRGDFGNSFRPGRAPVGPDLAYRFEVSGVLGLYGLVVVILLGIPIGVISAVWQYSWIDYLLRIIAIGFLSIPGFFIATLVLAYPPFGWVPPLGRYVAPWENPLSNLQLMLIPAILLGINASAVIMRYTRTIMLETIRQDYIRTARAKGLSARVILIRHALRNGLLPVITLLGLSLTTLLGGSVIYESIFGIPGVGSYLLQAASFQDYQAIQAVTFIVGVLVAIINLVVDVAYMYVDPRVRRQ